MRIHFFITPFFVSFFTPGSKKQEEKGILPPFPQKIGFLKIKLPYPYVPVASYGICTG